jgi:type I restriction enzyme R subunit
MFDEQNTVENYIRDLLCGPSAPAVRDGRVAYAGSDLVPTTGLGWSAMRAADLPRATTDVLVEPHVREALVRLNPEIARQPDRADEVIYQLRAILLTAPSEGLVRANEQFATWLRGEHSMPFGPHGEHVPVRLIDFEKPSNNRYVASTQFVYKAGPERRLDIVLLVNGIPLVVGECKTPTRPAVSWVDGAVQIQDDYERNIPAFFVPNVFSFATEGKAYRYGAIQMPLELWAPWREDEADPEGPTGGAEGPPLQELAVAVRDMLRPAVLLDILQNFSLFATDKKHRRSKVICRAQQYHAANQIVRRVVAGHPKKGLIWHFQGSGKSLLMVFAAQKLRLHPALKAPTVIVVVDRVDLDTQLSATFNAVDVPNTVPAESRKELETLLAQDVRKIILTTIYKFGEAEGVLNRRSNIIVLVDEAHRTQEGDLGRKMRTALPNAFLFGLTGTPINRRDRNTFWAFGAEEDEQGYMSRYSFEESLRDRATLPLHFEARLVEMRIDQAAIDEAYRALAGGLTEEDQENLARRAARMAVLVRAPERVQAVVRDIVQHFRDKVEPNGFKAQVVTFDRASCVLYKQAMDQILPPDASAVVMTVNAGENEWLEYARSKDDEERLLDRFRDPADPLKFLIVTSKLLTGFDAPILQAMYLDKPMRDHTLLQAICRTNRPYPGKSHGLIVDYIGVFDDVARALDFDDQSVLQVISNIQTLRDQLPGAMAECLSFFPDVDRTVTGYNGLLAAQQCLPYNESRDAFAAKFSVLARLWEALSPDPMLGEYEADYRWLSQVYESLKPSSGTGKLLWHALGAKTLELIYEHVHVDTVRYDLDTLVMDAEVLQRFMASGDPGEKTKQFEVELIDRLRKHKGNPRFVALSRRLEDLRSRLEKNLLTSVEYLKLLLDLARDVLQAEKGVDPEEERNAARAALTELFQETRGSKTPAVVERIVNDIDEIVRIVRFPGWQGTVAGEREVKKALRRTLFKYQLHQEQDLFDRAYAYIQEYY